MEIGVRRQVDLDERTLGAADRGKEVVGRERLADLRRAYVERGHPFRLEPDAHGKGATAENLRPLHAGERGQPRLDDAGEIVGDLVRLQNIGGEAEIGGCELGIGRQDVDHRNFSFRGQIVPLLIDLGADLGERLVRIVVEFEVRRNRRGALRTLRLQVIDAIGGRDRALERGGDKPAHQLCARAHVNRLHAYRSDVAPRILPDVERRNRLQPGDNNHEADDQCEHWPANKEIGK